MKLRHVFISMIGMGIPFFSIIFLCQWFFGTGDWNTVQALIFLFILLAAYVIEYLVFFKNPPNWLESLWYGFKRVNKKED